MNLHTTYNSERTKAVSSDCTNAFIILVYVFSSLGSKQKTECRGINGARNAKHQQYIVQSQISEIQAWEGYKSKKTRDNMMYLEERQQAPTMPRAEINKMMDPKDMTNTSGSVSTEEDPPVHKKVEVGDEILFEAAKYTMTIPPTRTIPFIASNNIWLKSFDPNKDLQQPQARAMSTLVPKTGDIDANAPVFFSTTATFCMIACPHLSLLLTADCTPCCSGGNGGLLQRRQWRRLQQRGGHVERVGCTVREQEDFTHFWASWLIL